MLRISALGPFELWRADRRVEADRWPTRQTLGLLKILTDQRGRTVPADRLAELLWPDAEGDAARNRLRVTVRALRVVLEPDLARGATSHYVVTEREGYRLAAEACDVDVDRFVAARERGRAAERGGEAGAAIAGYREALALYRGDYFGDDATAEWALAERERLRERAVDVAEQLAALSVSEGDAERALAAAERGLAIDPLREPLYRLAMRAHAVAGRRAHALAAYDRCRRVLRSELGLEPSAATERERETIAGERIGTASSDVAERGDLVVPFIGRARELASLRRLWERSATEAGHVALVTGILGIGKTELARTLAGSIGPQVRVAWMSAQESDRGVRFAPILGHLAGWIERAATSAQLERLGAHAPVLIELVPGARALLPAARPVERRPDESERVEALTRTLLLALGGRALIVLDDIQWCDDPTLVCVGQVLARAPGAMLVATLRDEASGGEGLAAFRSGRSRAGRLTEIPLSPLGREDVATVVAAVCGSSVDAMRLADRLYDATRGQPLFVAETLRHLVATGSLIPGGDGRYEPSTALRVDAPLPVAATVRDAIASRVAAIGDDALDLLRAMAVLDGRIDTNGIARIAGRSRARALLALEELLDARLLRTTEDGHAYELAHPLLRRVVYEGLSPGRREDWHRRAAVALEADATRPGAAAAALAHLVAANAESADIARVAELAGDRALTGGAYADAATAYETARRHLASLLPDRAVRTRLDSLLERAAEADVHAGRLEDAIRAYEELLARAASAAERTRFRRMLAGVLGDVRGRFDDALALLDAADAELDAAGIDDRLERGRIAATRCIALFYRGDFTDVIANAERALETWERTDGIDRERLEVLQRLAAAEQRLGRLARAERAFRRALAIARSIGDRLDEARAEGSLAAVAHHRGELATAIALHERSLAAFREAGAHKFELIALANLADALIDAGELRRACELMERTIERAESLDATYTVMHVLVNLGKARIRASENAAARDALERGLALAEKIGNVQRAAHARMHLAEVALAERDATRARELAERAMADGAAIGDSMSAREGGAILARALVATGDPAAAVEHARTALETARSGGFGLSEGRALRALAEALAATGASAEGREALASAETVFRAAGATVELALTRAAGRRPAPA
jgi:DNA-binding SARP family transcriptional activator